MAMNPAGRITRLSVHPEARRSASVNRTRARLNGLGRKGQTEPFRVQGSRALRQIARDVFPLSMRALETVTMYDREERVRTLADE